MIMDFCGGEPSEPRISGDFPKDGYPNRDNVVAYRPQRLADLGGINLDPEQQAAILARLEFLRLESNDPESWVSEEQRLAMLALGKADAWFIRAPTWRPDVDGEADIVEEIRAHTRL